jgi:hypothetical protein
MLGQQATEDTEPCCNRAVRLDGDLFDSLDRVVLLKPIFHMIASPLISMIVVRERQ